MYNISLDLTKSDILVLRSRRSFAAQFSRYVLLRIGNEYEEGFYRKRIRETRAVHGAAGAG
ncbi:MULTISPECIES: hypothetical protein [unclassified Microcoleus]|uniref:hypothetical protein n=1 Tax=unclassified Microcoleus TaxID=2642155 RepID=UPI002FD2C23C